MRYLTLNNLMMKTFFYHSQGYLNTSNLFSMTGFRRITSIPSCSMALLRTLKSMAIRNITNFSQKHLLRSLLLTTTWKSRRRYPWSS